MPRSSLRDELFEKEGAGDALTVRAMKTPYDEALAYKLYLKYHKTKRPKDLNAAFEALLPAFSSLIKRIRHWDKPIDLVSPVAWEFYRDIKRCKFPVDKGEEGFRISVWWSCYSAIQHYQAKSRSSQVIRRHHRWFCQDMPYGRTMTPSQVEVKIFLEELPKLIATTLISRIRFKDKACRKACKQILFNLLTNQKTYTGQVATHFGISRDRVQFLVDYMRVQVKSFLYEIKNEFDWRVVSDWRDVFEFMDLDEATYALNEEKYTERSA